MFTLFATSPEVSSTAVSETDGFFDPFREEHFNNTKIQSIYGTQFLAAQKESLVNSIPDFYMKGQGEYFNALRKSVFAANNRQISTKLALHKAVKKWEDITNKNGRDGQIKQWKFLKKSYPKNLQKILN